jgi:hypothetical protein
MRLQRPSIAPTGHCGHRSAVAGTRARGTFPSAAASALSKAADPSFVAVGVIYSELSGL